jgi:hypothetical protein
MDHLNRQRLPGLSVMGAIRAEKMVKKDSQTPDRPAK